MALEAEEHREFITEAIMKLPNSQQFLTPGRLVVVKSDSVCIHRIWFSLHTFAVPFCNYFYLRSSITLLTTIQLL